MASVSRSWVPRVSAYAMPPRSSSSSSGMRVSVASEAATNRGTATAWPVSTSYRAHSTVGFWRR